MRVILIDDEKGPLGLFTEYIADKNVNCSFFTEQAQDCLTAIKAEKFDAVFLDIRMPMPNFSDGVALAQKIIEIDKNIKIFFITAYSFNEVDIKNKIGKNLIKICQKPFSKADVDEWINLLQKSLRYERRILIKTFGEFSLHVDNELIKFDSLKSQELLAYLVHYNGNYAYRDRTATYLWQNQEDSKKI
ncbi:MAG: response regulator, partial [Clostridia bacterium]